MAGVKGQRSGGQNRKSARLHVLQGTFRAHRQPQGAPEPPQGTPTKPKALTGEGAAEWERMVERFSLSGTLSLVDGAALYQYCRLHAGAEQLQRDADRLTSTWFEKVSVDGAGQEHREPKVHPVFAQLRQYRMALRVWLTEFGLTPAARSRVKLPTGDARTPQDAKKARYLDALTAK